MHITECIGCSQENPVESFQHQEHELKLKSMPMKPLRLHPTLYTVVTGKELYRFLTDLITTPYMMRDADTVHCMTKGG